MSLLYPLTWDLASRRDPEDGRLVVDITAAGSARARQRHDRYRFDVVHTYIAEADALALQTWFEAYEGETVQIAWRDGRTYEGLLGVWEVDRIQGPWWRARAEIRGARVMPA